MSGEKDTDNPLSSTLIEKCHPDLLHWDSAVGDFRGKWERVDVFMCSKFSVKSILLMRRENKSKPGKIKENSLLRSLNNLYQSDNLQLERQLCVDSEAVPRQ